ncbi:S-layer homology domain-containing protein [Brevibacillus gelatini]|uniref:S-layer homology domain-containing protein n=1 Tax=Brevibacillus gelatini TaxID=1655277 RepID=A0A3M8AX12_9BACL|nr:S-layer homology domain-containing protein [Brevibacillus gelatini]RNB55698.1 S-layer homology domain-containing protein [Brevibacillus gelatini]
MRKSLLFLSLIISLLFTHPVLASPHFKDVDHVKHAYAIPSINFMVEKGVLSGYGDGTFQPDRYVDKAEFTVMIYNLFDKLRRSSSPCLDPNNDFIYADVPTWHWAYKQISEVYGRGGSGIFQFYEYNPDNLRLYFRPDSQITRWNALNMMGYVLKGTSSFEGTESQVLETVKNLKLKDIKLVEIERDDPNTWPSDFLDGYDNLLQ